MIGWIIGGLAVVLVGVFLASRARSYRRLFADEHFIEIGRAGAGLKAAALANVIRAEGDAPASPSDPRIVMSAAGLAIVYTVRKVESGFVHHWSVSVPGGYTAHAVGATFVVFVAGLVGLPIDKVRFEIGKSTVHHGEATLDQGDHDLLATATVPEVSRANVAQLRRASVDARSGIQWQRLRT